MIETMKTRHVKLIIAFIYVYSCFYVVQGVIINYNLCPRGCVLLNLQKFTKNLLSEKIDKINRLKFFMII